MNKSFLPILFVVYFVFMASLATWGITNKSWKADLVSKGYADYCTETGK